MPNNPTKRKTPAPVPGIKHIIAVASGKGGVGKSTVAVNLALALQGLGARVGLLDADIYGPSQPHLLGLADAGKPEVKEGRFQPHRAHGLVSMSIGYLIDAKAPTIWRGPMVSGALLQMLNQTDWGSIDYLVVDLPLGLATFSLPWRKNPSQWGCSLLRRPNLWHWPMRKKPSQCFLKLDVPVVRALLKI